MTDAPLTDALLESLLYEDEGAALDFKRDPYPFAEAEPHQKAELLKDVLAFANAFRRATAYILIGVEDVPGGRGIVHGVDHHPDDASLQQFVNGKTNRPVAFRYRAREVDGKQVGILEVPVQTRPLYLNKSYAGLKAHAVYVRRSSSTDIASPDEIARMGTAAAPAPVPEVAVSFGHADSDTRLGDAIATACTAFQMPGRLPNYSNKTTMPGGYSFDLGVSNSHFYREFADYCRDVYGLSGVSVAVDNTGTEPLVGGRVRVHAPRGKGFVLAQESTPEPNQAMPRMVFRNPAPRAEWSVVERGVLWEASFDIGTVHPGGTAWTETLFLGGTISGEYAVELAVFAENLATPLKRDVTVTLDVRNETLSAERLIQWANGSPPLDLIL